MSASLCAIFRQFVMDHPARTKKEIRFDNWMCSKSPDINETKGKAKYIKRLGKSDRRYAQALQHRFHKRQRRQAKLEVQKQLADTHARELLFKVEQECLDILSENILNAQEYDSDMNMFSLPKRVEKQSPTVEIDYIPIEERIVATFQPKTLIFAQAYGLPQPEPKPQLDGPVWKVPIKWYYTHEGD